jgi:uncharacterized protein (DUF305 family)
MGILSLRFVPVALLLLLGCLATSCRSASGGAAPIVRPGAPGEASRVVGAEAAVAAQAELPRFTPADVKFMQGMIGHHAQALEMTALLPSRTANPDMLLLARRIDISQRDEIKMMQTWLTDRGQELPGPHAHHMPGGMMPGMLTPEEMSRLAAAKGKEFDRLFLEGMIRHHDGALTMVKELFAQPGAGQESDIFAFASDVDADQRMEIVRMSALLKELQK